MRTLRLKRLVETSILLAVAPFAAIVEGADSFVPPSWNVAPMTNGAYLESFDIDLPNWAGLIGVSVVTNDFPSMTGSSLPVRSNAWFGANAKVLKLDTEGGVLSNMVAHTEGGSAVSFESNPVYVDMRVRFDAVTEPPNNATINTAKIGLFVSSDLKLVAIHAGGWSTNAVALDTNLWYQVTFKMLNGQCDVLLNDSPVFEGLTIRNVGTENTLEGASFCGTGLIDELYISHGDPAFAVTGPTESIPDLPATGSNPPTDAQQTRINAWLGAYSGITASTTLSMTQDQLSQAYLINELGGDSTTATAVSYTFGISNIEMTSPTLLQVTVSLTANSTAKNGTINGKIQLQGKVNYSDANWTTLAGAITPSYADFTDGKATYTYTIPSGGYQFFRPLIVP